jgi:hypothetical protein
MNVPIQSEEIIRKLSIKSDNLFEGQYESVEIKECINEHLRCRIIISCFIHMKLTKTSVSGYSAYRCMFENFGYIIQIIAFLFFRLNYLLKKKKKNQQLKKKHLHYL